MKTHNFTLEQTNIRNEHKKKIGELKRDMKSCYINHSNLQMIPKLILKKKTFHRTVISRFIRLYFIDFIFAFIFLQLLTKITHFPNHVFFVIISLITLDVESIFVTFYFRLTFSFSNIFMPDLLIYLILFMTLEMKNHWFSQLPLHRTFAF